MPDIETVNALLGRASVAAHGHPTRAVISFGGSMLWYRLEADAGPLRHTTTSAHALAIPGGSDEYYHQDEYDAATDGQIADALMAAADRRIDDNRREYALCAAVEAGVSEECRSRLAGLRMRCTWRSMYGGFTLRGEWTGLTDTLRRGNQYLHLDTNRPKPVEEIVAGLEQKAKRDRRLEAMAARGLTFDPPLEALVAEKGWDRDDFVDRAVAHGFGVCRDRSEKGAGPMVYDGTTLSLAISDGQVKSEIKFNDKVSWSKGCVTARDVVVPDTLVSGSVGRRVRDVVDHPWLEGLTITSLNHSRSKAGRDCLTIMTRKAA